MGCSMKALVGIGLLLLTRDGYVESGQVPLPIHLFLLV